MTIETKAREWAVKEYPILADGPIAREKEKTINGKIERAYLAGAAEAVRWVSVSERLPEYGQKVILSRDLVDHRDEYVTDYSQEDEFYLKMNDVTHWMPLPPHPEKEQL